GDHGKLQALFEYASLIGELVECDAVSLPTYDWGSAAATAISMASRITGRRAALVPASMGAERRSLVDGYCETACVYFEMPGFLGTIETQAEELARLAREAGALTVVGVDPVSLGVLEAP